MYIMSMSLFLAKLLQPCLMFLSKVRAYQSGLSGAPQTSDLAGNSCQRQTIAYYEYQLNYGRKKYFDIVPGTSMSC
jgi:hypothetical protein